MSTKTVAFDVQKCPTCDSDDTTVDYAIAQGRDGAEGYVLIRSNGEVGVKQFDGGDELADDVEHVLTLVGTCNTCRGDFDIVFIRQSGRTVIETVATTAEWSVLSDEQLNDYVKEATP